MAPQREERLTPSPPLDVTPRFSSPDLNNIPDLQAEDDADYIEDAEYRSHHSDSNSNLPSDNGQQFDSRLMDMVFDVKSLYWRYHPLPRMSYLEPNNGDVMLHCERMELCHVALTTGWSMETLLWSLSNKNRILTGDFKLIASCWDLFGLLNKNWTTRRNLPEEQQQAAAPFAVGPPADLTNPPLCRVCMITWYFQMCPTQGCNTLLKFVCTSSMCWQRRLLKFPKGYEDIVCLALVCGRCRRQIREQRQAQFTMPLFVRDQADLIRLRENASSDFIVEVMSFDSVPAEHACLKASDRCIVDFFVWCFECGLSKNLMFYCYDCGRITITLLPYLFPAIASNYYWWHCLNRVLIRRLETDDPLTIHFSKSFKLSLDIIETACQFGVIYFYYVPPRSFVVKHTVTMPILYFIDLYVDVLEPEGVVPQAAPNAGDENLHFHT